MRNNLLKKDLKESEEQEIFINFLNDLKKIKKILDFHIVPNENYLLSLIPENKRNKILNSMKKKGLKPGVPDIFIYTKEKLIIIELKRTNKSKTKITKSQKYWNQILNQANYIEAFICYGSQAAIQTVLKEIENTKK